MTAIECLTSFITAGRFLGSGVGSAITDVDGAIRVDFIDDVDETGQSIRRDYGFVELTFHPVPEWVVVGAAFQLHRLAAEPSLAEEWAERMGVEFPRYLAWDQLRAELRRVVPTLDLTIREQGGFVEYRAPVSNVSVLVVDEPEDERGYRVGHQDVWSVSVWGALQRD
ncbi:hypothetical protein QFZ82_004358 [Streptomyces sp. V4I23]|uniref:hypothetical protein n=1 Tax=Streptomyces sp. V4I23 TaxID=3042282 RepID=UPI0027802F23|nr:hypothetical protein [Streptomyces sp. V4I23]MDQ1009873.1 hypothetical protein [Streptomyces sp. V4I23]